MDDGSVLVVELKPGTLTRVKPDGSVEVVDPGGIPTRNLGLLLFRTLCQNLPQNLARPGKR